MPFFTLFTLSLVLVVSSTAVQAGGTVRVAVDSAGAQGNSGASSLRSRHWAWVAFASGATNLVAGDTNAATDIFVHDLKTGQTVRVAVDSAGAKATTVASSPQSRPRAGVVGHSIRVPPPGGGHERIDDATTRPVAEIAGRSYCCCLGPG